MSAHIWPPAEWCSAINPERTHICDQPRGHDGDHRGPEMPTVEIDEPVDWDAPDFGGCVHLGTTVSDAHTASEDAAEDAR